MAVKLFRLGLPPERVHLLNAEFEALVTAGLAHPSIATPLAAGIVSVEPYLGQDFVAAESLDLVFREGGSTLPADAVRVLAQLASALDFAASRQVLHGSMHPRDVLISVDEARLTGIGITRALERVGASAPLRRPYTAPERAAGSSWDRRADVFSLAVIAYEMIWGRRLAGAGDQAAGSLTKVEGGDLAALRRTFARALAEDPEQRFGSALDFTKALSEAFQRTSRVATSPARTDRPLIAIAAAPAEEYDVVMRADEPKNRAAGTIDVSADVYAKEDAPPVVVPPADHVLSYVDRASSSFAFAASTAVELPEPPNSSAGIRPLALALLLGVAIGFAGGYGMGNQVRPEEEAATIDELPVSSGSSAGPALLAMTADPPRPARREFTEEQVKSRPVSDAIAGRIVVRSTPAGARVVVNGRDVGRTPITMNNLSRGSHDVRIERDGYGPVERHVVVTDSQPESQLMVALARELPAPPPPAPIRPSTKASGSLGVDSRPGGARVFVDGKLAGATPLSLDALAPGEYAVRLEREGYRHWASIVRVVAGESHRVAASLEADTPTPPRR